MRNDIKSLIIGNRLTQSVLSALRLKELSCFGWRIWWKHILFRYMFLKYRLHHLEIHELIIEISDTCNAKCLFCTTGMENRKKEKKKRKKFIEPDFFEKIVHYCKQQNFIQKDTVVNLINWGEPFLHPEFEKIIEISHLEHLNIFLSSNASVFPKISNNFNASCIKYMIFSMPGFSQASYDKIHQLNFEQVISNISKIVETFRISNPNIFFIIHFHVYRFNVHEIEAAYKFTKDLKIHIYPYFAFINDYERHRDFLLGKSSPNDLELIKKFLFSKREIPYLPMKKCMFFNKVLINPAGECELCCINRTKIGNIFEMTPEKLSKCFEESKTCKECLPLGIPN